MAHIGQSAVRRDRHPTRYLRLHWYRGHHGMTFGVNGQDLAGLSASPGRYVGEGAIRRDRHTVGGESGRYKIHDRMTLCVDDRDVAVAKGARHIGESAI